MSSSPDQGEPLIERKAGNNSPEDLAGRALRLRIRQQELLAELGVLALQRTSFIGLLNHTARMTAEGLGEFINLCPDRRRLLSPPTLPALQGTALLQAWKRENLP
jgi:hypothetical protein